MNCEESESELLLLPIPDDEAGGGPLLVPDRAPMPPARPPREATVLVRERLGCDRCFRIVNSRLRLLLLPLLLRELYEVAEESVVGEVSDEYMSDGVLSYLDEEDPEDMAATAAPRRLFRFMGPEEYRRPSPLPELVVMLSGEDRQEAESSVSESSWPMTPGWPLAMRTRRSSAEEEAPLEDIGGRRGSWEALRLLSF